MHIQFLQVEAAAEDIEPNGLGDGNRSGFGIQRRFSLPPRMHTAMQTVPWIALAGLWVLAFAGSSFPATHAEPFEVWSAGFFAFLPGAIFIVGLLSAIFLPQGYCHYGCPTGALLKFLTHAPSRWTRRDTIATGLIALGVLIALVM